MTPNPIHNPELHLMEERNLLVDEERVGHPDLVDVVSSNNQLRHAVLNYIIIMKVWLNNYIFTNHSFFNSTHNANAKQQSFAL